MKRIHILALVFVVAAIGVVLSLSMNTSTYADFNEATAHAGREFHVIGTLSPDRPMHYDAKTDANAFSFYMLDNAGNEMLVKYTDTKPQDFEKLDQLVVIGEMKEGYFEAHKMNLKCPSKYNDDQMPGEYSETSYGK
ncbi:MAG: cytochrome c maturation protein CcmE [Lentimicrobium sp.]|jgi:cytochrome c-type biogenesis protein CcmE|nr:cytochrome c maturation protein CcmE [Lentimicrobium sp.]MDD2528644.1 cytochrome c maturation protein CcmE [Lentimicrobiaceae bacterium]MDD4596789.1 cytochrome c maturation protein CcmE [Lentimicrobiaceae bacterium]MDY0027118.1 cytochrome c maturation protein CcmE [Lentimicrobium sp.]HAH59121.1 cytochrome C biogenesis protein [Bacteroidales bacterium]